MNDEGGFIGDMYACKQEGKLFGRSIIQFVFDEICHGTGSATANCDFDVEE